MSDRRFSAPLAFGDGESPTVERPGPGLAPSAFLIWHAGVNMSDDGPDVFSARSAELVLAEQDARGNLYSFDFDHMSLKENRPAEAGRAAGWHRLEVRYDAEGNAELWAVDVEWCADTKAGLEEKPPRWRYFSPAFSIDPDSREVVSYINTAVCVNPKTWNNNQLATRASGSTEMGMTKAQREKLAVLAYAHSQMSAEDTSDELKATARAMYTLNGGDEEMASLRKLAEPEEETSAEGEPDPETSAEGDEPGDDDTEETATRAEGDEDDEEEKKRAAELAASTAARAAAPEACAATRAKKAAKADPTAKDAPALRALTELGNRVKELEAQRATDMAERRQERVDRMLAGRKDLTPALRAAYRKLLPSQVREILAGMPKETVQRAKAATATRGETQGTGEGAIAPQSVQDEVDAAMGIKKPAAGPVVGFGKPVNGRRVFHTRRPSEYRAQKFAEATERAAKVYATRAMAGFAAIAKPEGTG